MKNNESVKVWQDEITLPTYPVAPPEKAPLFIESRAYQGSSGKVYPLPVTEKIEDKPVDQTYQAIYLENQYLKVMILPELGGRIQRAYDKTNDYDFVYYNHVIKPALVGLTGPWISGGIEFNWPQHHRPTTYSPVEYAYEENADGSATVFVSELDQMYGTKGMGKFTLYPDKAYIEIKGQLYNNTDLPQTFLWWANPAVPVNDHTYSVFPPDVNAVMDHGKRAVSTFPIATGEYYKFDYSEGVDISMYKNVEVPTSYMAAHSDYDFIGNYDGQLESGLLHVADHHISPGKKQWTWGNADFGQAWDRNLTDEDGPYIELMTGVYTDNQPDFTWLKPHEEKTFTQYFMPYKGVGRVKNATKNAAANLTFGNGIGEVAIYTTAAYENLRLTINDSDGGVIYEKSLTLDPGSSFTDTFTSELTAGSSTGCTLMLTTSKGETLVSYTVPKTELAATPEPAEKLPAPLELKSTEELYLAGQHLEQYRHATREPADYYEEGLRRDPTDIRLNNAYGLLKMRRGHLEEAKALFEAAINKQTWKNPNPYYGESYFNLGLVQVLLGEDAQAYDAFYKSTWSYETESPGYYWLATLACKQKNYESALEFLGQSLLRNWHDIKARTLKIACLRALGRDTKEELTRALEIDPLYIGLLFEEGHCTGDFTKFQRVMRGCINNYLELALLYMDAGLYADALAILEDITTLSPMANYYQGYIYQLLGDSKKALLAYQAGEKVDPDGCFPSKIIEMLILTDATKVLPEAPFANYYLGNLLYDKKQYKAATKCWETCTNLRPDYGMAYRNLSIAYYNKEKNPEKALVAIEKAYTLDPDYPRLLMEYDQMRAINRVAPEARLELLEEKLGVVKERDALYVNYINLLNLTGKYTEALDHISNHLFHPWEGGEGKVSGAYRYALTGNAIKAMEAGNYQEAITLLEKTLTYPENLGEGKLPNVQDNIAHYYLGKCYQAQGMDEKAHHYFILASKGIDEPASVLYYNDQPSDTMLYQGLACEELADNKSAKRNYHLLKSFGEKHLFDEVEYDFFAVSLPEFNIYGEDIGDNNVTYCNYLIALSEIGLKNYSEAERRLHELLEVHPDHQGALMHLKYIERMK